MKSIFDNINKDNQQRSSTNPIQDAQDRGERVIQTGTRKMKSIFDAPEVLEEEKKKTVQQPGGTPPSGGGTTPPSPGTPSPLPPQPSPGPEPSLSPLQRILQLHDEDVAERKRASGIADFAVQPGANQFDQQQQQLEDQQEKNRRAAIANGDAEAIKAVLKKNMEKVSALRSEVRLKNMAQGSGLTSAPGAVPSFTLNDGTQEIDQQEKGLQAIAQEAITVARGREYTATGNIILNNKSLDEIGQKVRQDLWDLGIRDGSNPREDMRVREALKGFTGVTDIDRKKATPTRTIIAEEEVQERKYKNMQYGLNAMAAARVNEMEELMKTGAAEAIAEYNTLQKNPQKNAARIADLEATPAIRQYNNIRTAFDEIQDKNERLADGLPHVKWRQDYDRFKEFAGEKLRAQRSGRTFGDRAMSGTDTGLKDFLFGRSGTELSDQDIKDFAELHNVSEEKARDFAKIYKQSGVPAKILTSATLALDDQILGLRRFFGENTDMANVAKQRLRKNLEGDRFSRLVDTDPVTGKTKYNWNLEALTNTMAETTGQVALYGLEGMLGGGALAAAGRGVAAATGSAAGAALPAGISAPLVQAFTTAGRVGSTFASGFAGEYESAYQEAIAETNDEAKARQYAAWKAGIVGASELILPDVAILEKVTGARRLGLKAFDDLVFNKKLPTGAAIMRGVAELAKTVGAENIEELLPVAAKPILQNGILDRSIPASELMSEALDTLVQTTIGTLPLGIGGGINNSSSALRKEALYAAGMDYQNQLRRIDELEKKGDLAADEAARRRQIVSTLRDITQSNRLSATGEELSEEQRIELTAQEYRRRTNQSLAAANPSLAPQVQADNLAAEQIMRTALTPAADPANVEVDAASVNLDELKRDTADDSVLDEVDDVLGNSEALGGRFARTDLLEGTNDVANEIILTNGFSSLDEIGDTDVFRVTRNNATIRVTGAQLKQNIVSPLNTQSDATENSEAQNEEGNRIGNSNQPVGTEAREQEPATSGTPVNGTDAGNSNQQGKGKRKNKKNKVTVKALPKVITLFTDEDGYLNLNGEKWNFLSDDAVVHKLEGGVEQVTLTAPDGSKRTFRGRYADAIAAEVARPTARPNAAEVTPAPAPVGEQVTLFGQPLTDGNGEPILYTQSEQTAPQGTPAAGGLTPAAVNLLAVYDRNAGNGIGGRVEDFISEMSDAMGDPRQIAAENGVQWDSEEDTFEDLIDALRAKIAAPSEVMQSRSGVTARLELLPDGTYKFVEDGEETTDQDQQDNRQQEDERPGETESVAQSDESTAPAITWAERLAGVFVFGGVGQVAIRSIVPNSRFRKGVIKKTNGKPVTEPILVWASKGKIYVLDGKRRLQDAINNGQATIPARFLLGSEADAYEVAQLTRSVPAEEYRRMRKDRVMALPTRSFREYVLQNLLPKFAVGQKRPWSLADFSRNMGFGGTNTNRLSMAEGTRIGAGDITNLTRAGILSDNPARNPMAFDEYVEEWARDNNYQGSTRALEVEMGQLLMDFQTEESVVAELERANNITSSPVPPRIVPMYANDNEAIFISEENLQAPLMNSVAGAAFVELSDEENNTMTELIRRHTTGTEVDMTAVYDELQSSQDDIINRLARKLAIYATIKQNEAEEDAQSVRNTGSDDFTEAEESTTEEGEDGYPTAWDQTNTGWQPAITDEDMFQRQSIVRGLPTLTRKQAKRLERALSGAFGSKIWFSRKKFLQALGLGGSRQADMPPPPAQAEDVRVARSMLGFIKPLSQQEYQQQYGKEYTKNRTHWYKYLGRRMTTGLSLHGTIISLSQRFNVPADLLFTSAMEEGMELRFTDPNSVSEAYVNNEKDLVGFPVDGFYNYGLDYFGAEFPRLVKAGLLPEGFSANFKTYKAVSEGGATVTTAAFKTDEDALLAKAAMMSMARRDAQKQMQAVGATSSRVLDLATLLNYNMGAAKTTQMLQSFKEKGYLANDKFLQKDFIPSSWKDVFANVQKRQVNAIALSNMGYFNTNDIASNTVMFSRPALADKALFLIDRMEAINREVEVAEAALSAEQRNTYRTPERVKDLTDRLNNARKQAQKTKQSLQDALVEGQADNAAREGISSLTPRTIYNQAGEPLGIFRNGEVFLNMGVARIDTPFHEIGGHGLGKWARENQPELFAKMVSVAKQAPETLVNTIRKIYPELGDTDMFWEEVFAHVVSLDSRNIERMNAIANEERTFWQEVRATINELYNAFYNFLVDRGIIRPQETFNVDEFRNMTLSDFANLVGEKLTSGKRVSAPKGQHLRGFADYGFLDDNDFVRDNYGNPVAVRPDVMQEIVEEKEFIRQQAIAAGNYMMAPDGTRSQLTEDQWLTVRTRRFQAWDQGYDETAFRRASDVDKVPVPEERIAGGTLADVYSAIREKGINKDTIKQIEAYAKAIQAGARYTRFNDEQLEGIRRGGQLHAEATLIAGGSLKAGEIYKGKKLERYEAAERQEADLEKWAKKKGLWIKNVTEHLTALYGDRFDAGVESQVWYDEERGVVVKASTTLGYKDAIAFFDGLTLHNAYFPETALTVTGFGYDPNEEAFNVIVEQVAVKVNAEGRRATEAETDVVAKEAGFGPYDRGLPFSYRKEGVNLHDMHDGNVLVGEDGKFYVIDTIMSLQNPPDEATVEMTDTYYQRAFRAGQLQPTGRALRNEHGEPKVFYHGTFNDFSTFRGDKANYFADVSAYASDFAKRWSWLNGFETGGRLQPAFIRAAAAFDVTKPEHKALYEEAQSLGMAQPLGDDGTLDSRDVEGLRRYFEASRQNFDTVLNVYENIPQLGVNKSVAILNPRNIKSAIGNTTFSNETGDVRFQRIGERSALTMAQTQNLKTAQKMEGEKASARDIYLSTGWFRGLDNKWRYELPNDNVKFLGATEGTAASFALRSIANPIFSSQYTPQEILQIAKNDPINPVTDPEELNKLEDFVASKAFFLDDILEYEELYDAHPDLRTLRVSFRADMKGGSYNPSEDTIELSTTMTKQDQYYVLRHEIQHALQKRLGFEIGSNKFLANEYINKKIAHLRGLENKHKALRDDLQKRAARAGVGSRQFEELSSQAQRAADTMEEYRDEADYWKKNRLSLVQTIYRSFAGEIEANEVMDRAMGKEFDTIDRIEFNRRGRAIIRGEDRLFTGDGRMKSDPIVQLTEKLQEQWPVTCPI